MSDRSTDTALAARTEAILSRNAVKIDKRRTVLHLRPRAYTVLACSVPVFVRTIAGSVSVFGDGSSYMSLRAGNSGAYLDIFADLSARRPSL